MAEIVAIYVVVHVGIDHFRIARKKLMYGFYCVCKYKKWTPQRQLYLDKGNCATQ